MTNTSTGRARHSEMSKVTGMLLVVALLFSSQAPAAEAFPGNIKRDWSRVQTVPPGTRTTVVLYRDLAPRGKRKIKGRFHSATAESVTLQLEQGQTRTVEKKDVRRVLVYRPVGQRYQVVATAAAGGALLGLGLLVMLGPGYTFYAPTFAKWAAAFLVAPTSVALLLAPKMGGIYNVPRKSKKRQGSAPNRRN